MKNYNLQNIVMLPSRNGYSMNCDLTIDGVLVCEMWDSGDGSQPDFDIKDKNLFDQLQKDIDNLPELFIVQYECEMKIDMAMFIDLLNYALETKTSFNLLSA